MGDERESIADEYLTREEAAHMLSISTSELRRRQRLGDIRAAPKRGPRNVVLFKLQDVEYFLEKLQKERASYTSDEAAMVFEAMERGLTPVQCVIELKIKPSIAQALMAAYASLKSGIFLAADELKRINDLDLDGPFPIERSIDVLEAFQFFASQKCKQCGKRERAVCVTCMKGALAKRSGEAEL